MSNQSTIRAILETRLAAWAAARVPPLPVLWENARTAQEPTADHLRAYVLPATTTSPFLAGNGRSYRGLFQVSIFLLPGAGARKAETIAGDLDALFPCAERYTSAGLTVQVLTPASIGPALQETDWHMVPVRFTYGAEATV